MIVSYQSLIDDGLLPVPGVPHPTAIRALRRASIELCTRAKLWVVTHDPIDLQANESVYAFEPDSGAAVLRVEEAWASGIKLTPTTRYDLQNANLRANYNWTEVTGTPTHYYQENSEELILWPIPDSAASAALTLKVALIPTQKSTGIEGWILERYQEGILHGATEELLEMPGQPWTDLNAAKYHEKEFDEAVQEASLQAQKGFGKAALRTRPQYF